MEVATKKVLLLRGYRIVIVTFDLIRSAADIRLLLEQLEENGYAMSDFGVIATVELAGRRPPERFKRVGPMLDYLAKLDGLPYEVSFTFRNRVDRGEGQIRPLSDGLFLKTLAGLILQDKILRRKTLENPSFFMPSILCLSHLAHIWRTNAFNRYNIFRLRQDRFHTVRH